MRVPEPWYRARESRASTEPQEVMLMETEALVEHGRPFARAELFPMNEAED